MPTIKQLSRVVLFFMLLVSLGALAYATVATTNWQAVHNYIIESIDDSPQPGYYKVVSFSDGDTISVDMNGVEERIRFIGVDTPEKNHPNKGVQCFAQAASDYTKQLIGSNDVRLEADPTNDNRDRYDRLLRYIYLADGTLVNQKIIEDGYGFAYLGFPFQKSTDFEAAENIARAESRGLWSACTIDFGQNNPQTNEVE